MGNELAGCTGKVLACLCQGLEVGELVWTVRFACKDVEPLREHHHVARTQGAVGEKGRNRVSDLTSSFRLYRLLDLWLLDSHRLWTWSSLASGLDHGTGLVLELLACWR